MSYKVSTDSTSDLGQKIISEYNIGILPLHVLMGGVDHYDGIDINSDEIMKRVSAGEDLPITASANPEEYLERFREWSSQYDFVIHVTISSEFSSAYQNACIAADDFDNVYVVDSRNLSTGQGLVVLEAIQLAEEGCNPQVIVEKLCELTSRVESSFILEQLSYMHKGGRCSSIAALGANMLKLRPAIEVFDGKMSVAKKYRGSFENCLQAYIRDTLSGRDDLDLRRIFVTHSQVPKEIESLAVETVKGLQAFEEVITTDTGCTVFSHCGPGTIGVLFIRK